MSLKQPIGQKRLTNVALVRYKKKGKRFEIACYKNKVVNWRTGVEKELDEVLQTTAVFSNVSKGVLAKHEDLLDVFETDNEEEICRKILNEGDYQVSDKERDLELESLFKDVASVLAEKCVNPSTNRPYTISMLERALRDIHFSVDPKRGAKQQALEVLPKLKQKIPISRARMRLKVQMPRADTNDVAKELSAFVASKGATIESKESSGAQDVLVCQIDPSCFRDIHSFVQRATEGSGHVEVVSLSVMEQGEAHTQFNAWGSSQAASEGVSTDLLGREDLTSQSDVPSRRHFNSARDENGNASAEAVTKILYSKGLISGLPEEFQARRERFAELDELQGGWLVELSQKQGSSTVDAVFFAPNGERAGTFAAARRAAMKSRTSQG